MTIPNVTMRWCTLKATCQWCRQYIENGTPMAVVFYWNKGGDNRKWNVKHYYHPNCWVAQGMDYLSRNPYVPQKRERKPTLSEEDRRKRQLLVMKFHKAVQMKKNCNLNYPDSVLEEIRLTQVMVDTMMEVATLGGVPKKWVERL